MITQEQLESKVRSFYPADLHPNDCIELDKLTDDQVFALTAWEFWKDGMDWDSGVPAIAMGKGAPLLHTRELCVQALKLIYGY